MRVALFGGTFDPIHHGHLAVAAAAADTFALDQVLFAPAGRQPLKPEHPSAAFPDRPLVLKAPIARWRGWFSACVIFSGFPCNTSTRHVVQRAIPPQRCRTDRSDRYRASEAPVSRRRV